MSDASSFSLMPEAQTLPTNQEPSNPQPILKTEWKQQFNQIIRAAKSLEKSKQHLPALWKYFDASQIAKKPKIDTKLAKLRKICVQSNLHETKEAFKLVHDPWHFNVVSGDYHLKRTEPDNGGAESKDYILRAATYHALYEYQREAMVWFWRVFQSPNGGILGDDMGLGKTVQMSAYLDGAFWSGLIRCVLLIVPVSMMSHWTKELEAWCSLPSGFRIKKYHSSVSEKRRRENIGYIARRGGVLITSYGMIQKNAGEMSLETLSQSEEPWDYMILDEGHVIKNQSIGISQAVRSIAVRRSNRILLSGTFLQNELSELWSLFDFISEGALFGSRSDFNEQFASQINEGRMKNASFSQKQRSVELTNAIKAKIAPFLLRRMKQGLAAKGRAGGDGNDSRCDDGGDGGHGDDCKESAQSASKSPMLSAEKRELVVWVQMTRIQCNIYRTFLESDAVKEALNTTKSPLAALTVLKKICNNPFLLSDELDDDGNCQIDRGVERTLSTSSKMAVLMLILKQLIGGGHKVLVFSQYKAILSTIESLLQKQGTARYLRMDGDSKIEDRQKLVDAFNASAELNVFLLSTKVGGLGLNLTGSDRVIIYDPAWNPATDAQAVDRSYRIGQSNDVMVYRLVTCGTIEEKIYRRQISKVGLLRSVTGHSNQQRYFSKSELREVFKLEDPSMSRTQRQFEHLSRHRIGSNPALDRESLCVERMESVFGVSHHDLLFNSCRPQEFSENPELMEQIEAAKSGLSREQSPTRSMELDGDEESEDDDEYRVTERTPNVSGNKKRRIIAESDSDEEWEPPH